MKKTIIFSILCSLALVACKSQQEPTVSMKPQSIEFTAQREMVRLNGQLPNSDELTVTVEAEAIIFDSILKIEDFTKPQKRIQPAVDFLIKYYKTIAEGDVEEIVSMWHSAEQAEKKATIVKHFDVVKKYHTTNKSLEILGVVFQENTQYILLKLDQWVISMGVIQENGEFRVTNGKEDDLELAIIEASLKERFKF